MTEISLALLWHMHQPSYRLQGEEACFLPWVRLHAIRSYYDMIRVLEEFPEVRVTMNLTPSLVEQIRAYEKGASDLFWDVAKVPADAMDEAQRRFLFDHFFSAQREKMIAPIPRYLELLERRNRYRETGMADGYKRFSAADCRDLKALFDLSWFGFRAREDFPELEELLNKGYGFSEADIGTIHDAERKILAGLLRLYSEAAERGQIEISCSPFAHPILPLLIDTDCAREAMPQVNLPPPFRFPEDARRQILDALGYMERELGRRPAGMWPSEGSVSQELLRMLSDLGVKWIGAGESVLRRSDLTDEFNLYRAWVSADRPGGTLLVFRDRDLSDRIGFSYARAPEPDKAAEEFLRLALERVAHSSQACLAFVALDGENPWEHYTDGGAHFLRALYKTISAHSGVRPRTVSDTLGHCSHRGRIRRLHAGSWINGDFGIWIGGPEKNRAWTLLGRVRSELADPLRSADLPESDRQKAWAALRYAEGSDWFWWLDGQFESLYVAQFDETFRAHLRQAYESLHLTPPEDVNFPIASQERRAENRAALRPFAHISPRIDGYQTDFFEWLGAVRVPWKSVRAASTMESGREPVGEVRIGFSSEGVLFFRMDPPENDFGDCFADLALVLSFKGAADARTIAIRLDKNRRVASVGGTRTHAPVIAARKIFEMSVPAEEAALASGQRCTLVVSVRTALGSGATRPIELHVPIFRGEGHRGAPA